MIELKSTFNSHFEIGHNPAEKSYDHNLNECKIIHQTKLKLF